MEDYLHTLKQIISCKGWPVRDWAQIVAPLLAGEVQLAYYAEGRDSGVLWAVTYHRATELQKWAYKAGPRSQMDSLLCKGQKTATTKAVVRCTHVPE